MRIITRCRQEETARRIRLLQDQLADAKSETLEQARANGRLVRDAETAQAELERLCAGLRDGHRELRAERDRLQQQVAALQAQLDLATRPDKKLALGAELAVAEQADAA